MYLFVNDIVFADIGKYNWVELSYILPHETICTYVYLLTFGIVQKYSSIVSTEYGSPNSQMNVGAKRRNNVCILGLLRMLTQTQRDIDLNGFCDRLKIHLLRSTWNSFIDKFNYWCIDMQLFDWINSCCHYIGISIDGIQAGSSFHLVRFKRKFNCLMSTARRNIQVFSIIRFPF